MSTTALQIKRSQLPIEGIDAYLQRIHTIPLLTQEEEYDLAVRLQEHGDLQAAQTLILAHLRYVARIARGYLGYGLPLADLIQEGTVGLMKAVKRFKPERGVRLVSFAMHWIKAEMHEFILKNWRIVKVATTKAQRKLFFNLRSAKKRLGWSTAAEVAAIADDLGVNTAEVLRMEQRMSARDTQFDVPEEGEHAHAMLAPVEYLQDPAGDPALQWETQNWGETAEQNLKEALCHLDERSRDILEKRWLSDAKMTLEDLALVYKISPERVRQVEKNAFHKLRTMLEAA